MKEMTTHERYARMFAHQEADRIPIVDEPWEGTLARWRQEGMPAGVDWRDFFGVDKVETVMLDISPRYEIRTLEETETHTIATTPWGVTLKQFKKLDSTPEFLDYTIVDPGSWEKAKARMTVDRDRIDWKQVDRDFRLWKSDHRWIQAGFWFGFDVTHSWTVGTETVLIAMMEEPEWMMDMFGHYLDMCIAHYDMLWDAGYRFDSIFWWDDMGFKNTTFFSADTYRRLIKPFHRKAAEWAHAKGIKAHLHSCGYVRPLVDDILDAGIDALNPLEHKAGMDALEIKAAYGERLVLHGGVDAVLWDDRDRILAEIEALVPTLMKNGGYIFSSDHSIPNSVSLENFRAIVGRVKEIGRYR